MADISKGITSPSTYNIYDHGYKTGAQTNIFIGPIWLEEVVSIQWRTGTSDAPVYPYSSAYHDRLMLGKYTVGGTLAVSYTQPDYLLRILESAADISIQDGELYNLIESRKSIFADTIKSRLMTDKLLADGTYSMTENRLTKYAADYVERISREIEVMSYSGQRYNPRQFELTIVTGSLYDNNQSIEIYEDVKIVGTGRTAANDDQPQIEFYDFVARRKPERKERFTMAPPVGYLSRENLLQMAKEVAEKLVGEITKSPKIKGVAPTHRTSLMTNTDRLAIAGLLNPRGRMYGKEASFIETTWSLEYPLTFSTYQADDGTFSDIASTTKLLATIDGKETTTDVKLIPPDRDGQGPRQAFDNSYGKIVAVDRTRTARYISAVGPVAAQTLTSRLGGTIALPRYRRNDFDVGSFIMPSIVPVDGFNYVDSDLEALTTSTLWCCLTGFRCTGGNPKTDTSLENAIEDPTTYITEIAQPVNSFAYVDHITSEWEEGNPFKLKFGAPVYIDYVNTATKGTEGKSTKKPLSAGKTDGEIVFEFPSVGTPTIKYYENGSESDDTETTDLYQQSDFRIVYAQHDLPHTSGEVENLEPLFFEVSKATSSAAMATNFSKCVYLVPLVFSPRVSITGLTCGGATHTAVGTLEQTPEGSALPSDSAERLAYYLATRNQRDDSCDIDITYDWMVKDAAGFVNVGEMLSFHGVLFATPKLSKKRWYVTCPTCGQRVPLWDITGVHTNLKLDVFWILATIPMRRDKPGDDDASDSDGNEFKYTHDLDSLAGRYVEIYNITRCDAQMMNLQMLADRGSGWEDVVNAFKTAFNVDIPTMEYLMPIKARMARLAFFLRGFGFRIDIDMIVSQMLKCRFSDDVSAATKVKLPENANNNGWTLASALAVSVSKDTKSVQANQNKVSRTTASDNNVTGDIYAELAGIVRNVLIDALSSAGTRREAEQTGRALIIAERDLITPAPNVVEYGLTEDGYNDLIGASTATQSTSILEPIQLGGYDE